MLDKHNCLTKGGFLCFDIDKEGAYCILYIIYLMIYNERYMIKFVKEYVLCRQYQK